MRSNFRIGLVFSGCCLLSCAGQDKAADMGQDKSANGTGETAQQSTARQALTLFPGSGTSGAGEPLASEIAPATAHECVDPGSGASVDDLPITTCYFDAANPTELAASLERRLEVVNDQEWHHIRLTFNPAFVDNTFGANAIGWGGEDAAQIEDMPPTMPGDMMAPKDKICLLYTSPSPRD
jgi:hypothetical protein